ncbi:MAG: hypothetical protein IPN92_15450 [Chromatiaceae bacterium]|nr:hypothetical protein [Chromatiaceae bacterium]
MSHFITPNARRFALLTALLLTLAGPQAATANETGSATSPAMAPLLPSAWPPTAAILIQFLGVE